MLNKEEIYVAGILRRLFKNRFLLRSKNEFWFQILVEHQGQVRSFLNKMAADLELDSTWGVAYIKPLSVEIEDQLDYQLGKQATLSRYSSLLIYFLRLQRLNFYRNPEGEAPLVKREDMRVFLIDFNTHLDSSRFEREFNKCIQELIDIQILLRSSVEDLFEISPVCDVLLTADNLSSFRSRFELYFKSLSKRPDSEQAEGADELESELE